MRFELIVLGYSLILIPVACFYSSWVMKRFQTPVAYYPEGFSRPLESLRGLAAVIVLMAHTTMYYYATGHGDGSKASSLLGQSGVTWFFMLTGYLFWNMVLSDRLDLGSFFQKRLRRLVPAMVGMVSAAMLYEWGLAGFPVPNGAQLLALFKNYLFYFAGVNDVFYPDIVRRINVLWTLRWEWLFYISLPLIAAVTRRWVGLTLILLGMSLTLTDVAATWRTESDAALFIAFYIGMSSAILDRHIRRNLDAYRGTISYLSSPFVLFVAILIFVSTLSMPAELIRARNIQFVLLNVPIFFWFLLISHSTSATNRVITHPWLLDLGRISYSVYLWHLLVAYIVHRWFETGVLPGMNSKVMYAVMPLLVIAVTIPISVLSYKYLELPFMRARKSAV